ncbi:MAG: DUF2259 domain-containing protein [Gammaproteobacteria bacterium]
MKNVVLAAVSLALPALANAREDYTHAGYLNQMEFMGFSEDGRFLGYRETPSSECDECDKTLTYYVDTVGNSYVKNPATPIKAGNLGQHVVSHKLSDLSVDPHRVRFKRSPYDVGIGDDFELRIVEKKADSPDCNKLDIYGENAQLLELTLTDLKTKKSWVLQNDTQLPKRRGCPDGYSIQDIYVYGQDIIAVFLNKFSACPEGPCVEPMVVTGRITP